MSNPRGLITPQEAKKLNDAYTERCDLISTAITKRPDNRSSWYSLDDIETFLSSAKAQAQELGHEMDGIRIYCGAYETEKGEVGYTTNFMVPTSHNQEDGKSHDIQGANGLNFGQGGDPPAANYPQ